MTDKIREQILAVRKTGRTNMFDVPMVQYIANEMRFDIVNIGLHFFLKDVRPMLPPVMNHSIAVA